MTTDNVQVAEHFLREAETRLTQPVSDEVNVSNSPNARSSLRPMTDAEARQAKLNVLMAQLAVLQAKRNAIIEKSDNLGRERKQVSHAANLGNKKQVIRLDEITLDASKHTKALASLDDAIEEAQSRIAAANRNWAAADDRAAAIEQQALLKKFAELGNDIHEDLEDAVRDMLKLQEVHTEMYRLGLRIPSNDQLRILGARAVRTMLCSMPKLWRMELDIDMLAPGERKYFNSLTQGWSATLLRDIEARIGDVKQKEDA